MLKHLFFGMLLMVMGHSSAVSANVAPGVTLANAAYHASDAIPYTTGLVAMGNLARSGATQLSYNAAGRLRSVTWNSGTPWDFGYNGFGQRVSKSVACAVRTK